MKVHIITVGQPKLDFAKSGWQEYIKRLGRYHQVRTTHLADKSADDAAKFLDAAGSAFMVGLVIKARQFTSQQLATFLDDRARQGQYKKDNEVCFMIGGPEGLPADVIDAADLQWSLSELTLPHDLAMVVCAEALYRASTIGAGHPYHRE